MPKCPICETLVENSSYTETYTSPFNNQEYKKYECPNCELHWWEPLKIIPEFYESEVFESYVSFHEGIRSRIGHNHQQFFIHFPQNVKGRLLDVGCGDGVFLREAQKHGFEVWGIDFDSKSINTAKKSLGVDTLFAMSLEEFYEYAKKNSLTFDVITFFEVLEHQDNPKRFLEMVRDLLKPGGYIAGSVPNRESPFVIDLYQKIISYNDNPPHHFLRFSAKALENTLKICGFSDVEVYKTDFPKEELLPYLEKKFFGSLDKVKLWLKGKALGNQRLARAVAVEDLEKIKPSFQAKLLKILKKPYRFLFSILIAFYSIIHSKKLRGNSIYLYFQGRKNKKFYDST